MIIKKVKNRENGKPMAWQINDLVDYIRSPQNRNPTEKVLHAGGWNFLTGTHNGQKSEMICLASEATHTNNPVSHWVMSWREGEVPSRQQTDEAVSIFLEQMGLQGHQVIYALHGDTKNVHLHIAVNRMSETLGKVVRPNNGFDIKVAHKAIAIIGNRQGWSAEKNAIYTVENGELVAQESRKRLRQSEAAKTFETRTGTKSAERVAQEKAYPVIVQAKSWQEIHTKLATMGIRFEKKGSGALIVVGDIPVKASSVHRTISMSKLCKRLGEFEPGDYPDPPKPLPPEPASTVNVEEWNEYQAEMAELDTQPDRQAALLELAREKQKLAEDMKKKAEGVARIGREHGPEMRRIARFCWQEDRRKRTATLWRRFNKGQRLKNKKPSFETWLLQKGYTKQAELWRHRRAIDAEVKPLRPAPHKTPPEVCPQLEDFRKYADAVDADRYRVTSIWMSKSGEKRAFIVDKNNGISQGFTPEEVSGNMYRVLNFAAQGANLYYTPLSKDKHHILIDDMTPENLNRFQQDGFRPAIVIETSPRNYQCVLTIPKLNSDFDREIANSLSAMLNKEYGDPKLSGAIHPHRAPGFQNRKPKHKREDGSYPATKLLLAEKRQCKKAFEMTWRIRQELEQQAEERKKRRQRQLAAMPRPATSATQAYYAHYDNIRQHFGADMDFSRMDAMIALRMRSNGHSQEAIRQAIFECAPTVREGSAKRRDWQDYATRTANYAYGTEGDLDLEKYKGLQEKWREIEGNQRQQQYQTQGTRLRM